MQIFLKHDQENLLAGGGDRDGGDFQIDRAHASGTFDGNFLLTDRFIVVFDERQRRTNGIQKGMAGNFREIESRSAGGRLEILAEVAPDAEDFQVFIDDNAGGQVARDEEALGLLELQRVRGTRRGGASAARGRKLGNVLGKIGHQGGATGFLAENVFAAIGRGEIVEELVDVFRFTQDQAAGRIEGVVELGDDALLRERMQAAQIMAATNQVHAREGGIIGQILAGKNTKVANGLGNEVSGAGGEEEIFEAQRRDVGEASRIVDAGASGLQRSFVRIGGEDLNLRLGEFAIGRGGGARFGEELR